MNAARAIVLTLIVLVAGSHLQALPQRTQGTLSEQDVIRLLKMGASSKAVTALIQQHGISFQPDEEILQRLKKAGAQDTLLEAIRLAAPPAKMKPPEPTPREDTAKLLEAARHLKLGQLKAQDKDFEGALREFAEAEKVRPQWADVFYQRGLVFATLERYAEAAAEWKKYLSVAGGEADSRTVQDKIVEWEYQAEKIEKLKHLVEEGDRQLKEFNSDAAIAAFQEALKMKPSLSNLLGLAHGYWIKGDYDSLAKTSAQALGTDPNSSQATLYQAAAELGGNAIDRSITTVQRALLLDPNLALGHALLCDAYRIKADLRNAQPQCEESLRIDNNCALAHNRLGWILWKQGKYQVALEELRKAAQSESKNADWHADLSYALNYQGDLEGAQVAAKEALRLNPQSPSAHDALGLALEAQGNLDGAIQEFNEAIRLKKGTQPEFIDHLNAAVKKQRAPAR